MNEPQSNRERPSPMMPANDFFDFNRTDSRRSFLLLALGATLGLAIAGYGLFTSKGTSTNRLPPEDMAGAMRALGASEEKMQKLAAQGAHGKAS